jgi:transposase-like protein
VTLAAVGQCSESRARHITEQLRQSLTISANLLMEAYEARVWVTLGYDSWQDYTNAELGEVRLRLPREDRREVVASMTEAGMSARAISSALGVSKNTVTEDRAQVSQSGTPDEPVDAEIVGDEPDDLGDRIARELAASDEHYAEQATHSVGREPAAVLGTDGKTYPVTPKPAVQRRRALPQAFWEATHDLTKQVEKVVRLTDDDRFPQNAEQVAATHRGDLLRAIDALQSVLNRLPSA